MKADRILIIEKDEALAVELVSALEKAGYSVIRTVDIIGGIKKVYESPPDLIIVGQELPNMTKTKEDPCLRIRQATYVPLIVLGDADEATEMLELAADAYITKPPSLIELVARVHSLLRRKPRYDSPGGSPIENHLDKGDGSDGLTPTEFRLASCLDFNRGRLLDYPQLITEVWGEKAVSRHTLHFYMRRLRAKLDNIRIVAVRGVGYCLEDAT